MKRSRFRRIITGEVDFNPETATRTLCRKYNRQLALVHRGSDSRTKPGRLEGQQLTVKIAEAKAQCEDSFIGKMWALRGLDPAPYIIFDFRKSQHRDGPAAFFRTSRWIVRGDCFSQTTSVVVENNERLTFAAGGSNTRRKV